jgi:hypothetical protein
MKERKNNKTHLGKVELQDIFSEFKNRRIIMKTSLPYQPTMIHRKLMSCFKKKVNLDKI